MAYFGRGLSTFNFPCKNRVCLDILHLTSEGLVRTKYRNNELILEPALAKSWAFTNPTTLTIKLRENQKKSDGTHLIAQDFVNAWRQTLELKDIDAASPFFMIANAKEFFQRKVPFSKVGIKAIDNSTIELRLIDPSTHFIWSLATPSFRLREFNGYSVGPMTLAQKPHSLDFI